MPRLYEVTNFLNPTKDLKETIVEVGFNLDDYVRDKQVEYHVYVNNKPVSNGFQLHENDIALFVPKVHGTIAIGLIIAVIVAAAVYFFMDVPVPTMNGMPEPDPVYTLKGQQNQVKQGEPIERHYGQVRHWPSYASRPYNRFKGNEQFLYALLCVGVGEYIVDEVLVDDTPIGNFSDAEYEVYLPGQKVTLFPTHVQTSSEIGGIELKGTNQVGYDWSGPFVLVNAGYEAYRIQIDLSFRSGLYKTGSSGKLTKRSVSATFEYRKIDDSGNPIGSWELLTNFSKNLKTVKTKRYTLSIGVPPGRYEIRGKRTTSKPSDFKIRDTLHWESARAFITTEQNFGNVTLIAFKIKASNNLNDNSKNNFNVRIRSKSNVYNGTEWVIAETRSPIWAFCDILLADYGRNISPKYLDLDAIVSLAAEVEANGIYFDGTFDSRGTVWPALTECLMSSRCRPNLPGTLISIVRDVAMSIPTICLNAHNITPSSFKVSHAFTKTNDKDGLEVEYVNPITWEHETVLCLVGNDKGINLEKVMLPGCKDRDKAYQWGMYQRKSTVYKRTNVSLTTGLEGSTVSFGDLAAVQHDLLPNDENKIPEHTGKIVAPLYWSGLDTVMTLPFVPVFEDNETHRIALTDTQGVMRGPYLCTQGEGTTVIVEGNLDLTLFDVNDDEEKPSYFFGVTGKEVSLFKVIGISPGSQYGEVNLNLSPYDERVYESLGDIAPPLTNDFVIPQVTSYPVVSGLDVSTLPYNLNQVSVSWQPALNTNKYLVELSYDGEDYDSIDETDSSSLIIDADPGEIWVRVAAVGIGQGPWAIWTGIVGDAETEPFPPQKPALLEPFAGSNLYLSTSEEELATSYKWKINISDDALLANALIATITTDTNFLTYNSAQAKIDASAASLLLKRNITVSVIASNLIGDSEESESLAVSNPLPVVITGLTATVVQDLSGTKRVLFNWNASPETDIESYRLYSSITDGFTPDISNQVASTTANSAESILTTGVTRYYRLGVKDKWGEEIILTAQQSITP